MESGLTTFGRNLSALRHDLRNSVGHILGYSEMLQEDLEDHPDEEFSPNRKVSPDAGTPA